MSKPVSLVCPHCQSVDTQEFFPEVLSTNNYDRYCLNCSQTYSKEDEVRLIKQVDEESKWFI